MIGQTIAHYTITEKIGEGGMGEVYRATDGVLKRDVALKFLPESMAQDETARRRFLREARSAAALDHPFICQIHEIGEVDGVDFIAMEYVAGQTLKEKLVEGRLSVTECLRIASEIAEALELAQEKAIVHRDLKPTNIMLTSGGHMKLMDFGLAKRAAGAQEDTQQVDVTKLTQVGSTVGTVPYMSPEQLKGEAVDSRSDIFSFGIILYEMLTGVHPFIKPDAMATASSILQEEPAPLGLHREGISPVIQYMVRKMLAKEPERRYQLVGDIHTDLTALLQDTASLTFAPTEVPGGEPSASWNLLLWLMVPVALILGALAAWSLKPVPPEPLRRLEVSIGADASLAVSAYGTAAVLSPDGSLLAFVAQFEGGSQQLYVRPLDQLQATPLSGTEGVRQPFFSPGGQWIGFFADGKLKKISVTGGAAVTLCDAPNSRGGDWGDDGSIVFAAGNREGLSRVSSAGGTCQPLTTLDEEAGEITHRWPQLLPGSKAVLFTAVSTRAQSVEEAYLVVQTIPAGQRKIVQRGGYHGRYLPSGHLLYIREATLFAAPFDVQKLELTGQVVPILEGVLAIQNNGSAQVAYSQEGTLVYLPGVATRRQFTLINWLDRNGETKPLRDVPADYRDVRFAPGGQRLAVEIKEGAQSDIWAYEWVRDTLTRLTFDAANEADPLWSPNGDSLVFRSDREGARNIYWKRADGSGEAQRLTESRNLQIPKSWHPSGKFLAFLELDPETNFDIRILPLEGDDRSGWKSGQVTTFLNSPFAEVFPAFSPDGRWLAYSSNETGQDEIYVRPFPDPGGKSLISSGGGTIPIWSENGRELFYLSPTRQIMVATYSAEGESFEASKPGLWSEVRIAARPFDRVYDLHPDGERFAVLMAAQEQVEEKRDHVVLILNFFELLRQELGSQ